MTCIIPRCVCVTICTQQKQSYKNITTQSVASLHTPYLSVMPIVTFNFDLWPPKSKITMVNMSAKFDEEAANS